MPITVSMIEEKEFKTKMRGYDPVEVDEFLDEICDEMVAMQEEIASLNQRLSQASLAGSYAPAAAPVPVPPPVVAAPKPAPRVQEAPAPEKKEDNNEAAQRMLAMAQKVYDQTVAEAKAKAQEILGEANEKAAMDIESLEDEKRAVQEQLAMLKQTARDYRERFLRLMEDQQHILKTETSLFE